MGTEAWQEDMRADRCGERVDVGGEDGLWNVSRREDEECAGGVVEGGLCGCW